MKRLLLIAASALLALAAASCQKADGIADSLAGTTWTSEDEKYITFYDNHADICGITYDYDYDYPVVLFRPRMDIFADLEGRITGQSMKLTNLDNGKAIGVYVKQ